MNKIHHTLLLTLFIALLAASCGSTRFSKPPLANPKYRALSAADKQLADTLIKKVLDHEGLFTVLSGLKPMSSVTELYLMITKGDTLLRGKRQITDTTAEDLQKLKQYQAVVNALNFGDLKFMISPYRHTEKNTRLMQISVHRRSLIDSLLGAELAFFGQFGFVPGTRPEILINTTEYETSTTASVHMAISLAIRFMPLIFSQKLQSAPTKPVHS